MRILSLWAKGHILHARIIIILSHCLLILIACFLGEKLSQKGLALSPLWIYLLIAVYFTACALYPSQRHRDNFSKRKLADLVVATSGFLLVLCMSCQLNQPVPLSQTAMANLPSAPPYYRYPEAQRLLDQFRSGERTHFNRKEKRIIKKEFNYQLLRYAKAKLTGDKEGSNDALAILMVCIVAAGLLVLLGGLACSLSCNGSEAAAVVVGVFGTVAIVAGAVILIRHISKKSKTPKATTMK